MSLRATMTTRSCALITVSGRGVIVDHGHVVEIARAAGIGESSGRGGNQRDEITAIDARLPADHGLRDAVAHAQHLRVARADVGALGVGLHQRQHVDVGRHGVRSPRGAMDAGAAVLACLPW